MTETTRTRAEEFRSPVEEVQRIDFSGTIWFGSTLIASAVTLTGLLEAGWRPADLPMGNAVAWWVGAALAVIGIAGIAWAGCPVNGPNLDWDDKAKSIAIRASLGTFAVGSVIALLGVLLAPTW